MLALRGGAGLRADGSPGVGVEQQRDAGPSAGAEPGEPLGIGDIDDAKHGDQHAVETTAAQPGDRRSERGRALGRNEGEGVQEDPLGDGHGAGGEGLAAGAHQV